MCLQGRARVVALDRDTGETFSEDIGEDNFAAVYVPGNLAHGFEALTDVLMLYHVSEEYDRSDPDEHGLPWDDPRVVHLWSTTSPILSERDESRVLITGAGGQLGRALAEEFPRSRHAYARSELGRLPPGAGSTSAPGPRAACGRVDGRRRRRGRPSRRGRRQRRRNAACRRAGRARSSTTRPTTSSTAGRPRPYVESDPPNPLSAYGRTKLYGEGAAGERAWIVRSSGLFGPTGKNFVTTMLQLGRERDEVAVVDDQRSAPTYVGHLAAATRELLERPFGVWHLAAGGDAPGPSSPRRSSRRPASTRAFAASRATSSAGRRRARPTRCCGARRTRRCCRTGARAYAPASTAWGSSSSSGSVPRWRRARA